MKKYIFILLSFLILDSIVAQNSSKENEIYNKGCELLSNGYYNEALEKFNDAIKLDSTNYLFFQNRALTYSYLSDTENAVKDYNTALKLNPDNANLYYSLGNIYQKKKEFELAYNSYSKAINTAIKNSDTDKIYLYYFNRGNILLEMKKYEQAIIDFDSTENENPDFYDFYQNRGIAEYKTKKIEEACIDWYIASKNDYPYAEKYFNKNCKSLNIQKYVKPPELKGEEISGFKSYIGQHVVYPIKCHENNDQGIVFLKFQIDENGNISDVNVFSFAARELIIEAMRVLLTTDGKWAPASINNKKIKMSLMFPIIFRIAEEKDTGIFNKDAYYFFNTGNYKKAKDLFENYLKWNYDTTAVKDYIRIKYYLKDTADIDYYKYMLGKLNTKPSFIAEFLRNNKINNISSISRNQSNSKKADEIKTLYYNKVYELTDKEHASFYRITNWNPNFSFFNGKFSDYTVNDNLLQTGSYSSGYKNGYFKIYYPDSNISYAEGKYKENKMSGLWKYYYKTGTLKDEIVFNTDNFKIINSYSEKGDTLITDGNGTWMHKVLSYDGKNDVYVTGNIVDGMKEGMWILGNEEKILVKEKYHNDIFIKGKYYKNKIGLNIYEPVISLWVLSNFPIDRMGRLLGDKEKIIKLYPFINF